MQWNCPRGGILKLDFYENCIIMKQHLDETSVANSTRDKDTKDIQCSDRQTKK